MYEEIIGFNPNIKYSLTLEVLINMWIREEMSHNRWLFVEGYDITMINYITKGDIPTLVYFALKRDEEYNVVHIKFINVDYNYETRKIIEELKNIKVRIEDCVYKQLAYRIDEVSQGTYYCWEYRNYQEFIKAHMLKK